MHLRETRIASTQTRIVPLRIVQSKSFTAKELSINVTVVSETSTTIISVSFPIRHHRRWTSSSFEPIKASYFFAQSMPTSFVVLPPIAQNDGQPCPPILALRLLLPYVHYNHLTCRAGDLRWRWSKSAGTIFLG